MSKRISAGAYEFFVAHQDGTTAHLSLPVWLRTTDFTFSVELPDHYAACPDLHVASVDGESIERLVARFEEASEIYSRWKLGSNARPMLMFLSTRGLTEAGKLTFGFDAQVCVGLREVFVVDSGAIRTVYQRDGDKMGRRVAIEGTLLPDTPEVREQGARLIASVKTAEGVLANLAQHEDKLAFFMSIGADLSVAEPAPEPAPAPVDEPTRFVQVVDHYEDDDL